MEEKELKIVPPEGYVIDKENSTLECIKFKPIEKRWRDKDNEEIEGFYISEGSSIWGAVNRHNVPMSYNIFATMEQAKSALAMARISQIMKNDKRFGGIVTEEEWKDDSIHKYVIVSYKGEITSHDWRDCNYYYLAFHTPEQRDLFLKENEDLVKDYLMFD